MSKIKFDTESILQGHANRFSPLPDNWPWEVSMSASQTGVEITCTARKVGEVDPLNDPTFTVSIAWGEPMEFTDMWAAIKPQINATEIK